MSVLLNRQPQSKAKPASGTCRWVLPLGETGAGALEIHRGRYAALYEVVAFREQGAVVGYRLQKVTGGREALYDVDVRVEPWTCDCPDAVYRGAERPGGCKHVLALKAALAAAAKQ
jgi:hypothetical protein